MTDLNAKNDSSANHAPTAVPTSTRVAGEEQFLKGMAHLKGIGQAKDDGLAAASLLDASDLNHPTSLAACALLYFCGIGVTRNTQTAAEFAQKYLVLEPAGRCARIAHELVSGSLGSQNALKALHQLDNSAANLSDLTRVPTPAFAGTAQNKNLYILGGAAVVVLLVVLFVLIPKIGGGGATSEDPEKLFTSDELTVARQKALERAGLYRSDAKNQLQNDEK